MILPYEHQQNIENEATHTSSDSYLLPLEQIHQKKYHNIVLYNHERKSSNFVDAVNVKHIKMLAKLFNHFTYYLLRTLWNSIC
jgi:hypothetical protein